MFGRIYPHEGVRRFEGRTPSLLIALTLIDPSILSERSAKSSESQTTPPLEFLSHPSRFDLLKLTSSAFCARMVSSHSYPYLYTSRIQYARSSASSGRPVRRDYLRTTGRLKEDQAAFPQGKALHFLFTRAGTQPRLMLSATRVCVRNDMILL